MNKKKERLRVWENKIFLWTVGKWNVALHTPKWSLNLRERFCKPTHVLIELVFWRKRKFLWKVLNVNEKEPKCLQKKCLPESSSRCCWSCHSNSKKLLRVTVHSNPQSTPTVCLIESCWRNEYFEELGWRRLLLAKLHKNKLQKAFKLGKYRA